MDPIKMNNAETEKIVWHGKSSKIHWFKEYFLLLYYRLLVDSWGTLV